MASNGEVDRELAIYLLHHSRGYRELIKQRVHAARKAQKKKDASIATYFKRYHSLDGDRDEIGREVDGCG